MKHYNLLLFVFISILLPRMLYAETAYYVTMNGNGSHNGKSYVNSWSWTEFLNGANWSTSENPDRIDPGDIVCFSGTFALTSDAPVLPGDGSSGSYVILDGDDGVNPSATFTTGGNSSGSWAQFSLGNARFIEMRDFTFNTPHNGWQYGIEMTGANYIRIHDCIISTHNYGAVDIRAGSTNIDIYNNTIEWPREEKRKSNEGIRIVASNNINIYRNTLRNHQHALVQILSNVSADSHTISIYENYIDTGTAGYGHLIGVDGMWNGSGRVYNIDIHHNYFARNRAAGIDIEAAQDVNLYNNVFEEALNCCEDNMIDGVDSGCSHNYYNCHGGNAGCLGPDNPWDCCSGPGTGCGDNSKLYTGTGIFVSIFSRRGPAEDINIYNNTFGASAERALHINASGGYNVFRVNIVNNIFNDAANACRSSDDPKGSSTNSFDSLIWADESGGGYLENIVIDNNVFHDKGNTLTSDIIWDYVYFSTISHFESGNPSSPNGVVSAQNNIDGDPLFVKAGTDYSLTNSSPAVNAGADLSSTFQDGWDPTTQLPPNTVTTLNQNSYGTGWEIGAYVYTGGIPVNTAPVVNAGTDQTITLPASASLDGTVTDDNLPDPPAAVTTLWTKVNGPSMTFANENAVDTTASFSAEGVYVLRLSADDSDLQTSDDIAITVNPDTTAPSKPTGLMLVE